MEALTGVTLCVFIVKGLYDICNRGSSPRRSDKKEKSK